jgi:hypothetical protein
MADKIDRRVLSRRWVHSHEEDTATEMVFRPDSYRFPPSRGRRAFELRADGSMVSQGIGPDDRPTMRSGSWKIAGGNTIELNLDAAGGQPTAMEVLESAPEKLVVKK